jgi:hypothetical protein
LEPELAASHQGFSSDEVEEPEPIEATTSAGEWFKVIVGIAGVFVVLLSAGAALFTAQWLLNPEGFRQMRDRFLKLEQLETPASPPAPPNSQQ